NIRYKDAVFFFSSRRRHTRSKRDWSSDVCSSDLEKKIAHLVVLLDQAFSGLSFPHRTKRGQQVDLRMSKLAKERQSLKQPGDLTDWIHRAPPDGIVLAISLDWAVRLAHDMPGAKAS